MKKWVKEVTVGLVSHWPCITDNSGLPTYGLNDLRQGDEHYTYAPLEYGPLLPYLSATESCCKLYNRIVSNSHTPWSVTHSQTQYAKLLLFLA